jgi:hypothetical protein
VKKDYSKPKLSDSFDKSSRTAETAVLLETRVNDILRDEDIMWKYDEANVDHILSRLLNLKK